MELYYLPRYTADSLLTIQDAQFRIVSGCKMSAQFHLAMQVCVFLDKERNFSANSAAQVSPLIDWFEFEAPPIFSASPLSFIGKVDLPDVSLDEKIDVLVSLSPNCTFSKQKLNPMIEILLFFVFYNNLHHEFPFEFPST